MGLAMERKDGVRVKSVTTNGAAAMAGVIPGDSIVEIDSTDVKSVGDVRLALLDKQPGDHITMHIQRNDGAGKKDLTLELALQM
jgi:S1-C subfamily serine protease